jgi:hypothetical protein
MLFSLEFVLGIGNIYELTFTIMRELWETQERNLEHQADHQEDYWLVIKERNSHATPPPGGSVSQFKDLGSSVGASHLV